MMSSRFVGRLLHGLGLVLVFAATIFPVYWMVSSSFKTQNDLLASPPLWLFTPTLANYADVFADPKVVDAVINSLIVAIFSTGLSVALGTPAAFALARYDFRGKSDLWFWFISNRFISPIVLALPIYILARNIGILDTHLVLILVYITFIMPIVIWISTDQFRSIPKELEEAARLEGASQFDIFWRIYLPLGLPGIAVSAIFGFIFSWNELLYALVLTTTRRTNRTGRGDELHVGLRASLGKDHGDRHGHRPARDVFRIARVAPHGPWIDHGSHEVNAVLHASTPQTDTGTEELPPASGASRSASAASASSAASTSRPTRASSWSSSARPDAASPPCLRMIAGLEEVSGGDVFIDGTRVTDTEPAKRQVSMVFQSYALFPHMSVRDNIAFGLKMSKVPKAEIEKQVAEAARILQMEPLLDRKPRQLSGGQRQRVAIGRAIVRHPKLFLFDEPLSNLDAELRAQMRVEIARLHRDLGVTMIYVTHDQVEAMTLADRIVVLRSGLVEQVGSPQDLYDRPANTFVAGFIGSPKMNFLDVTVERRDGALLDLIHPGLASPLRVATRRSGRRGRSRRCRWCSA